LTAVSRDRAKFMQFRLCNRGPSRIGREDDPRPARTVRVADAASAAGPTP